jgi:hypothetical protein
VGAGKDVAPAQEFVGAAPQPAVQEPQTEVWKP